MPAINILIKPASSACNMGCKYCFYRDVAENRENAFTGMLSPDTMEYIIREAMEYAEGACTFAFQGGEPTLAGLDFYRSVIALEQKYARPGIAFHNALQTNGTLIDDAWTAFLAANHFLVGLSLDGPAELHDANRTDLRARGTFNRVMRAARLLEKYGASYNILCVITSKNARSIEKIYRFYRKSGFRWLQFIPCLEPLGAVRGTSPYALSVEAYGDYLIHIFDLWLADLRQGTYISIRHLDNWLSLLLGNPPELCSMVGHCSIQFVIEGDGGVYPCDFYVLDRWRMGTIGEDHFDQMLKSAAAQTFVDGSMHIPAACRDCRFVPICRNGCRRDRVAGPDGIIGKNYYCGAYQRFFHEREHALDEAIRLIASMRQKLR